MIRDMFTLMDTDNDGKVTYDELTAGLRKVGSQLAEPEIKLLMEVVKPLLLKPGVCLLCLCVIIHFESLMREGALGDTHTFVCFLAVVQCPWHLMIPVT